MPKAIERRTYNGTEIRVDPEKRVISGIVVPFDSPSVDMGFVEYVRPGAFRKTLEESESIKALKNHDTNLVLGNTHPSAGTLKLEEREEGLWAEIHPPDTTYANDLIESIKRRDTPGSSFMFTPIVDKWTKGRDGQPDRRELIEVQLHEVSVGVTFPAYPEANQITARDLKTLAEFGLDVDRVVEGIREYKESGVITSQETKRAIQASVSALRAIALTAERGPGVQNVHPSEEDRQIRTRQLRKRLELLTRC